MTPIVAIDTSCDQISKNISVCQQDKKSFQDCQRIFPVVAARKREGVMEIISGTWQPD